MSAFPPSGRELTGNINRSNERELPQRGGLKDYAPDDGSWLQAKRLEACYLERREALTEERVIKHVLSRGDWRPDLDRVELTKHTGTLWLRAGYTDQGRMMLYPEEALFLMDAGQLEVYFGGVALSLQQAFSTFLGSSVTLDKYQVYAHLSRLGYIIRRHISTEKNLPSSQMELTSYEEKVNLGHKQCSKRNRKRKKPKDTLHGEPKSKHGKEGEHNDRANTIVGIERTNIAVHTNSVEEELPLVQSESPNIDRDSDKFDKEHRVLNRGFVNLRAWKHEHCQRDKFDDTICHGNFSDIEFPDISKMTSIASDEADCSNLSLNGNVLMNKLKEVKHSFTSSSPKVTNWKQFKSLSDVELLQTSVGGVLWQGKVNPLLKPRDASSTGDVLNKLKVVENVNFETCAKSGADDAGIQIIYDVYQPDHSFRKSDPGTPYARVCISRCLDQAPGLAELSAAWQHSSDGVPVHWAIVDHGDVSFATFSGVDLPTDVTLG